MGNFWVEWDLPADRDVATFWRHSVGESVVLSAMTHNVEVRSSFRSKSTCCHNKYGIGPTEWWGGGYPTTVCNLAGGYDSCMDVAVMSLGSSGDGFSLNSPSNIFDAPSSNNDWPNRIQGGPPFLSVWLR